MNVSKFNGKQILFRSTAEIDRRIEQKAKEMTLSKSAFIRVAVLDYLNR